MVQPGSPSGQSPSIRPAPGPEAIAQPQEKLTHELANLLDGGLRNLSRTMLQLRGQAREQPADGAKPADPAILEQLESVNEAMRRMAHLIRTLNSPRNLEPRTFRSTRDVGTTVRHAIALLTPAAEMAGVKVEVDIDESLASLPAGPIYPVIANAVRNSLDAIAQEQRRSGAAPPGEIRIEGRLEDWVVFRIIDNGPGMNRRLFNEAGEFCFGRTTKSTGHGLGLSLSMDIARSLRGRLRPRNLSPRGTEILFTYPLSPSETEW
ncbi:MAG: hypothetical protein JJU36_03205 [Phycisphaeraceae bacterium]|nr:hypothetical protein [Phycisphaeraceae bacterium]